MLKKIASSISTSVSLPGSSSNNAPARSKSGRRSEHDFETLKWINDKYRESNELRGNAADRLIAAGPGGEVDLEQMGLTDLPDHLLARVADSRKIRLKGNSLNEVPRRMLTFAKLQSLDLSRNKLDALPSEIGQLTSVRKLDVSHNRLAELPAAVGQLTKLKSLRAGNNALEYLPASIGNLTNLRKLSLGENLLTNLPLQINRCSSLEELDISRNHFEKLPEAVGSLMQLRKLRIGDNDLTDKVFEVDDVEAEGETEPGLAIDRAIPESVGRLKNLRELDVSGNPLTFLPSDFGPLAYASTGRMTVRKFTDRPSVFPDLEIHIRNTPLPVELSKDGRLPRLATVPPVQYKELYQPPHVRERSVVDEDDLEPPLDAFEEHPISRTARAMPEVLAAQTALAGGGQSVLNELLRSLAASGQAAASGHAGMPPVRPQTDRGGYAGEPLQRVGQGGQNVRFAARGIDRPSSGAAAGPSSGPDNTRPLSRTSSSTSSRASSRGSSRAPGGHPTRAPRNDAGHAATNPPAQQAQTQMPYAEAYMAHHLGQPYLSQPYPLQPPYAQAAYMQPPYAPSIYAQPAPVQAAQNPALAELFRALAVSSSGPQPPQPLAAPLHTPQLRKSLFDYSTAAPARADRFATDMVGVRQMQHAKLAGLATRYTERIYPQGRWLERCVMQAKAGHSAPRDLWNLVVMMFRQHVICDLAEKVAKENAKKLAEDPSKTHLQIEPLPIALMYQVLVSRPNELEILGFDDLRRRLDGTPALQTMFGHMAAPEQHDFFRHHIMKEVKEAEQREGGRDLAAFAGKQEFWQTFLREQQLEAEMAWMSENHF